MCVMSPCVDIEEPSRELCRSARAAPTSSCSTGRGPGPLPSTQSFCGKPDWSCTWNCGHEQLFNTWYLTGHQFRSRHFMGTCQVQNLVLKCLPTLQTCNLRWRFPTFILQLVNVLETQPFFFLQILPPKTQSLFQEILSLALSMHPWYLHSPESPHMLCPMFHKLSRMLPYISSNAGLTYNGHFSFFQGRSKQITDCCLFCPPVPTCGAPAHLPTAISWLGLQLQTYSAQIT